jgi:hypothetical protein
VSQITAVQVEAEEESTALREEQELRAKGITVGMENRRMNLRAAVVVRGQSAQTVSKI